MIDGKNFQVKESKLIEWKLTVADPGFPKWKEVKPKREKSFDEVMFLHISLMTAINSAFNLKSFHFGINDISLQDLIKLKSKENLKCS